MIRLKIWNLLLFLRSECQSQIEILKAVFSYRAIKNNALYPILSQLGLPQLNAKYKPSTDYMKRSPRGCVLQRGQIQQFKSVSQCPGCLEKCSILSVMDGPVGLQCVLFCPYYVKGFREGWKQNINHPLGCMHTHAFNYLMICFHLTKAELFNVKDCMTPQETRFGTSFINVTVKCLSISCFHDLWEM